MKKTFYLLLLGLCAAGANAQHAKLQDSFRRTQLYNAYSVARQMVSMERQLHSMKPTDALSSDQKGYIESMLGALIWYANVQDQEEGKKLAALESALAKYPRLHAIYGAFTKGTYKLEFLEKESWVAAKNYIDSQVSNPNSHTRALESLKVMTATYFAAISNLKQTKAFIEDSKKRINLYILDTMAMGERKRAVAGLSDSTLRADSLYLLDTSILSKQQLLNILNDTLKKLEKTPEQQIADIAIQKQQIRTILTSNDLSTELKAVLAALANTSFSDFVKQMTNFTESIHSRQEQYVTTKEVQLAALEQASVTFRLPTEAQVIDAVAIYLAKRVKQEAVMWFFETIKKNANRYELLKTFFPNTITLLQSNEVYEIPNLGAQWRYALSKDFVKMPRNVLTSKWFATWYDSLKINRNINTREFLIASYDVCDLICQQYGYQQLVKQMYLNLHASATKDTISKVTPAHIFAILYAFNQECFIPLKHHGTDSAKTRLMRYEDFRNLTRDELEIMAGLMDMKYAHALGAIWQPADSIWFPNPKRAEEFRHWAGSIESAIEHFNKVQSDYEKLTAEIKDGKKIDAVYSVFNIWENVNGLIGAIIPDTSTRSATLKIIAKDMEKTKRQLSAAFEIYNQLSLKNYAGAVNSTISLAEELIYDSSFKFAWTTQMQQAIKLADTATRSFKELKKNYKLNDYNIIKQTEVLSALIFEQDRHAINLIRKLAGFLNDVMLTNDSKQLSKVVESYALPPGSYKRKRNNWWSLDLNAYVGGYVGRERIEGEKKSWGNVYGITAPIGIAISRTFGKKLCADTDSVLTDDLIRNPDKVRIGNKHIWRRTQHTLSFAVNIVDIGAMVSYRFSNTTDSTGKGLPKDLRWAQVLSPGFKLSYGIRNTPLVVSAGYQYTPQLRSITTSTDKTDAGPEHGRSTHRIFAGILFDLPLFNLWQRSYWRSNHKKQ